MRIGRRAFTIGAALAGCKSSETPVAKKTPEGRTVARIVTASPSVDGAGVHLARSIGGQALSFADPFLLLDEIRSHDPSEYEAGFPRHPHRGFETVTIMLEGAMEHQDSLGNKGRLTGGSLQWMTAGHGIIHSEMPKRDGSSFWGLQLWVNLPKSLKMTTPRYQDIAPSNVPDVKGARVLAGTYSGTKGPVEGIFVQPTVLDVTLTGDAFTHELPSDHTAVAYVLSGVALVGPERTSVPEKSLALLDKGATILLAGNARVLVMAAAPIREPVARRGPFVMNTEDELDQAWEDFRTGRLTQI